MTSERKIHRRGLLSVLTVVPGLVACSALPSDGPMASEVHAEKELKERFPFHFIKLDPEMLNAIAAGDARPPGLFAVEQGVRQIRIGPGDMLTVTIVEPEAGGLFTAPPANGAIGHENGAKVITLPGITVNDVGQVRVPFAGVISVGGLTELDAAKHIQAGFAGQAVALQVLVSLAQTASNRVTVSGAVKNPGLIALTDHGLTLEDAIAQAGGPTEQAQNLVVRLSRQGRNHTVRMQTLLEHPEFNVHVQSGDKVQVLVQPRDYVILGAAVKSEHGTLPLGGLTLAEALARSGGMNDFRADSRGVMMFRFERRETLERLSGIQARLGRRRGEDLPATLDPVTARLPADAPVPVLYELNMRSATGLFVAMQMAIREKDLVFVPDAESVQWQKFFDLLRIAYSPVEQGAISARSF